MNYFQDISLFSDLSESDQITLSSFCQEQEIEGGTYLFQEGEEASAMYLIKEGAFSVKKGEEQVAVLESGNIVGEIAFLNTGVSRNASVQAIETSKVVAIIRFSMDQMIQKSPELHQKIKDLIEGRLSI